MTKHEVPKAESAEAKEVFAFFGLAFYAANLLEVGVINLAVALLRRNVSGITTEDIDNLYASFDNKTFGQVLKLAEKEIKFPKDVSEKLKTALSQRNHLAHAYFKDNDVNFISHEGRTRMIEQLRKTIHEMNVLDDAMDVYFVEAWESLGISREQIEKEVSQRMEALVGKEKT